MTNAHFSLQQFLCDDTGQDLVEYGLIVGFMALASIAAMKNLTTSIGNMFGALGNTLTTSS
jgi:pilus assembly protein Flp/PilA